MEYLDHLSKYQLFKDAGPLVQLCHHLLISLVTSLDFSHKFINSEGYCGCGKDNYRRFGGTRYIPISGAEMSVNVYQITLRHIRGEEKSA
jgi:hypothetical protein